MAFFDGTWSGYLGVNRDDHNGGINFPIHVGTNSANGNGARLTSGGTWTNASSRQFKEKFRQLDGREVLEKIGDLPAESWEYRGTGERHIWPCSQDFLERFDVGVLTDDGSRDTEYLAAGDVAGVALVGVKELYRITQELETKTEQLQTLRAELTQLRELVNLLLAERDQNGETDNKLAANR